jgi:ankyrin repeat protein
MATLPNYRTLLHAAADKGHIEILQLLLKAKFNGEDEINKNDRDKLGNTALIYAVKNSHVRAVEVLLESGANPDIKNYDDKAAIDLAIESGRIDILKLLFDKGAKIDGVVSSNPEIIALLEAAKKQETAPHDDSVAGAQPGHASKLVDERKEDNRSSPAR